MCVNNMILIQGSLFPLIDIEFNNQKVKKYKIIGIEFSLGLKYLMPIKNLLGNKDEIDKTESSLPKKPR